MDKKEMLDQIMALDFALIDLGMFLDTHPTDEDAISLFSEYKRESEDLKAQYHIEFEPLRMGTREAENWDWVENPWPWESMFV